MQPLDDSHVAVAERDRRIIVGTLFQHEIEPRDARLAAGGKLLQTLVQVGEIDAFDPLQIAAAVFVQRHIVGVFIKIVDRDGVAAAAGVADILRQLFRGGRFARARAAGDENDLRRAVAGHGLGRGQQRAFVGAFFLCNFFGHMHH